MSFGASEYVVIDFPAPRIALPSGLTDAEIAVAHLLLSGLSNEDIARARSRSEATVAKQVAAVFRKFGVSSRGELAAAARRRPAER